jgi:cysteinyl-tRNA synthetase
VAAAQGSEPADSNILQGQSKVVAEARDRVLEALDRDLNTPQALTVIGELAKAGNEIVTQVPKMRKNPAQFEAVRGLAAKAARAMGAACAPLGLMQASSDAYWSRTRARRLRVCQLNAAMIDGKVEERTQARASKNFAKADALRQELTQLGVEVFDTPTGSTWKIGI